MHSSDNEIEQLTNALRMANETNERLLQRLATAEPKAALWDAYCQTVRGAQ